MIGFALLAPPADGSGFHLSTTALVIVAVVAIIGLIAALGFRAPDRSPGIDDKAERERIDD
jgi:hypothetical protein